MSEILKPDRAVMLKHIEFVRSGASDYDDGRTEVSGLLGRITENFTEAQRAADYGLALNKPGQNAYLVGALLDPDIMPTGRSSDENFYASTVIWCDIDDPHDNVTLQSLYAHCRPNRAVVTATTPHRRVQLWWKLDEPVTDPDTLREALQGVQQALNGDPMVTNPTSLMRLGGSINYPSDKKLATGRIIEETRYHEIHDITVNMDAFLRHYPVRDYVHLNDKITEAVKPVTHVKNSGGLSLTETIIDGRENYMHQLLAGCIVSWVKKNGCWPSERELFDEAWPTYVKKVDTVGGRTLDQDNRGEKMMRQKIKSKLRIFMNGGVRGAESLEAIIEQPERTRQQPAVNLPVALDIPDTSKVLRATPIDDIDLDHIPPREFLFGNMIGRKYVSMIVAPPGAGKSMFTLQMAVAIAAQTPWGEWSARQPDLNVWMYNNEEGQDELYRRLKAVMIKNNLTKGNFKGRFYLDSGETHSISIAKYKDDMVVHTPDFVALRQEVIDRKIDVLIVDPFAETHSVAENSNDQIKDVARLYRDIAIQCNCAVLLVHHTRKGVTGMAGEADSARGGGSQIGVVRRMFTLATMDADEAEKIGVPADKRKWFVRLDDAKTNITAPNSAATWFKFESVAIQNGSLIYPDGDTVGVLKPIKYEDIPSQFELETGGNNDYILQIISEYMGARDLKEVPRKDVVEYFKESSRLKFSERKLENMIDRAIKSWPKDLPYVYEGEGNLYSVIKTNDRKVGVKIYRKLCEI